MSQQQQKEPTTRNIYGNLVSCTLHGTFFLVLLFFLESFEIELINNQKCYFNKCISEFKFWLIKHCNRHSINILVLFILSTCWFLHVPMYIWRNKHTIHFKCQIIGLILAKMIINTRQTTLESESEWMRMAVSHPQFLYSMTHIHNWSANYRHASTNYSHVVYFLCAIDLVISFRFVKNNLLS